MGAQPSSAQDQLRSFSQALYRFANPGLETPDTFSYASWEQAVEQMAVLRRESRAAVFIDEFTYLLANTPAIAGIFQNVRDQRLKLSNLFLALCGSHLGIMERYTLAYQAPLYGRRPSSFGSPPTLRSDPRLLPRLRRGQPGGGVCAVWQHPSLLRAV